MHKKARRGITRQTMCVAKRTTWNPKWRAHGKDNSRVHTTRRIPFRTPGQLIEDAARLLVPEWRPVKVNVFVSESHPGYIEIFFGRDKEGTTLSVEIELQQNDARGFLLHAVTAGTLRGAMVCFEPPEQDRDGGEELPVPSVSELLAMVVSAGIS